MRRGGISFFKVNGVQYDVQGNVSYNLGRRKKTTIVGADRVHGYRDEAQAPFIELDITDKGDLDVAALLDVENATFVVGMTSGKAVVLRDGWHTGDGTVDAMAAKISLRFEGMSCQEVN